MSDERTGFITNTASLYLLLTRWVDKSQVILLVLFRLYIAKIFFLAGLTKIKSWDTTLMLFEYEYAVPVIPFDIAAYLSTFAELLFPVLLVIGLAGRFSAGALFILNIVAAISYPDISPGGVNDHYFWGTMLGILVFYGPGKLAIDAWIQKRFFASL
jgi:putative oxidoreductase